MAKEVILDDDVFMELASRAFQRGMVFGTVSDVLRDVLGMGEKKADNFPSSELREVQYLLDLLRPVIMRISKDGMAYHAKSRKWVAEPNVVTITVQEARAKNLRITVYGRPNEFESVRGPLEIEDDMAGYSRFVIRSAGELPATVKVIERSYELKKERGRLVTRRSGAGG